MAVGIFRHLLYSAGKQGSNPARVQEFLGLRGSTSKIIIDGVDTYRGGCAMWIRESGGKVRVYSTFLSFFLFSFSFRILQSLVSRSISRLIQVHIQA